MMTDEDTDDIQLLSQDGKRQRIFVVGQPERVIDFIEKVKSHNQDYIEDYNIDEEDNELAQINFKRPISNKQIIKIKKQLSTINIINNGISINSNSSLKQEEVELLTSNDKYYNLIKLREYFKRPLNKLEELRTRKRSIHSSGNSNTNSNRNSSIGSSSNMSNSFSSSMGHSMSSSSSSSSSSVVLSLQAYEELKQLIDKQRLYIEQKIDQLNAQVIKELTLLDSNKNSSDDSSNKKIIERINEMIANEGIFEYPELRKALQRDGYQDQGILTTFVNNKHYIDTLIEIFKPRNVVAVATSSYQYVQQQQTQIVQQYQQNQQNQLQEIQQHYPSFIQQGHQFTVQDEQQQQQQVIEIEDENGYKNSSGNGNINANQLAQLNVVQQDDNEINKLSSQTNATKNRERSLSPVYHRQKDAQQKSIDNNKKGYEQKMQKQRYSLSNDPTSKPIRLPKSPNNYSPNNNNKSRSITPQKNLNLNQ